jgi:hypothetical protein
LFIGEKNFLTFQEKHRIVDDWQLFKRAKEEIVQSENEMKNLLESIRTAISNLEEKKQVLSSFCDVDLDFKIVLINHEQERLTNLLQKSISWFRQEPNLFFITNEYDSSGSLFLNSQKADWVDQFYSESDSSDSENDDIDSEDSQSFDSD